MSELPPGIRLDDELLSHLPDEEAWVVLRGEGFDPDLIVEPEYKVIYKWAVEHNRNYGMPPTASAILDEFADLDYDFPEPLTAVGDLLDKMRLRYSDNRGRDIINEAIEQHQKDPTKVFKMLIQESQDAIDAATKRGEVYGTGDYDRAIKRYFERAKRGPGPSLGFPELDEHFYNQLGLTAIIGAPKSWKSWVMVKATIANIEHGFYPWLFSLELPAEEADMRLRCMLAEVPWWHYLKGCISPEERERMQDVSEMLDEAGSYRVIKPPEGQRDIESMVWQAKDAGADCVFIDQLQYVETEGRSLGSFGPETGRYFEVLCKARDLADEIPICFAHQFNRSVMNAEKMPNIQQAKNSAAIEETVTLALGLWASPELRASEPPRCLIGSLISRNYMDVIWEMEINLTDKCRLAIDGIHDPNE